MSKLEGTTLDRYRLLRRLGSGGMSTVYLAFDEGMHRNVAVKVVSGDHSDYIERFRREAEAIGKLVHHHILPAYDFGEQEIWHYLVMPYIEHGTLRERLAKGRLIPAEAGEMLEQIASALQFAHDRGIVHRDIKPSNILLRDDHYAYLGDFGLAKPMQGASEITRSGSLLGTPEYMAPDLAQGPATISSDVYALGILLYQMVTGRVPFTGETPVTVYWKQLNEQPEPPSHFNPALSRSLEQVILRALEKDPRRRFPTAAALAQAYQMALNAPTQHETEEMPFAPTQPEILAPGVEAAGVIPALPLQEGKLILPNPETAVPRPMAKNSSLRSLQPTQPVVYPPAASVPTPLSSPPRHRRRRDSSPGRRRLLVSTIIALSVILLLVVLIDLGLYNRQQQEPAGTATVTQGVTATASARASSTVQRGTPTATPNTQASATASAQATATAAVTVTATSGTSLLADPLSSNTNGRWLEDPVSCVFTGGSYHVLVKQSSFLQTCGSPTLSYDNAAFQVDVSLLSGNDAGLIFRVNSDQFYDFEINNQSQFFFRRHDAGATYALLLKDTKSSAILPGSQKNTLLVIANGNDFKLYINAIFVGETQDGTYSGGQVGFVTGTLAQVSGGEGSFANFKVFKAS